jgi:hypothetical protein
VKELADVLGSLALFGTWARMSFAHRSCCSAGAPGVEQPRMVECVGMVGG